MAKRQGDLPTEAICKALHDAQTGTIYASAADTDQGYDAAIEDAIDACTTALAMLRQARRGIMAGQRPESS